MLRRLIVLVAVFASLALSLSTHAQEQGENAEQATQQVPPGNDADAAADNEDDRPRWAKEPWEKIRYGVKAGASWASLRGELHIPDVGTFGFTGDYGFAAGVALEVPLSQKLSLQPEALIIRKYAAIDLSATDYTGSEKLSVSYFEVPLLLKWYPGSRRGAVPSLQAGPTVSLRMDALRESREPDGDIEDIEGKGLVRATDFGLTVGGGFEFHEFIWALTLDLRYTHGLSSVNNGNGGANAHWGALYFVAGVTW